MRHGDDEPAIGLILCKSHNEVVAEYALRGSNTPLGMSRYTLPEELSKALPSIDQLESELAVESDATK